MLVVFRELIEKYSVCFRVLGDWNLLPLDIQQMIAKSIAMTRNNNRYNGVENCQRKISVDRLDWRLVGCEQKRVKFITNFPG